MTHQATAEAYVRENLPELMEITAGQRVSWKGVNWRTGNPFPRREGVLSTWIVQGGIKKWHVQFDGLRELSDGFRVEELEILGHPIQLQHWLMVMPEYITIELWPDKILCSGGKTLLHRVWFDLPTGQPATEADYKAFNEIVGI